MNLDRATAIIDAYGADPARWPCDERPALLGLASHPAVVAAIAEATLLDRQIDLWAATPIVASDALAAATAVLASAPSRALPWRWAAGSGIAAALLAGVLLIGPETTPVPRNQLHVATSISDEQAFVSLFTPTPDEDSLI